MKKQQLALFLRCFSRLRVENMKNSTSISENDVETYAIVCQSASSGNVSSQKIRTFSSDNPLKHRLIMLGSLIVCHLQKYRKLHPVLETNKFYPSLYSTNIIIQLLHIYN